MLQAMNTGHDGSLTTLHANTPRDALSRLETMVLMAGRELPYRAIREQIASAIHIVVQQERLQDGSRRITEIAEVQGMEGDVVVMSPVYRFQRTGFDGKWVLGKLAAATPRPKIADKLAAHNVTLSPALFQQRAA